MAARENQGYLIAVIILVLLTLVLALAAFLGLSKAGENSTSRKAAEHKLLLSNTLSDANAYEADILKAYLGGYGISVAEVEPQIQALDNLATKSELDAAEKAQVQAIVDRVKLIQETYNKDMLGSVTTEEGEPAQQPTYRSKIDSLTQLVAKKNNDYSVQVKQTSISEAEATSKIAEMTSQLAANQKTLADLNQQLEDEKRRSLEKEAELKSKLDEAVAGNEAVNKQFQDFQSKSTDSIKALENEIADVEAKNANLKARINHFERDVFDRPDGQITRVMSRLRNVVIDLGSADGLTNNRTFSVYDQEVTNFDKGKHKAKIEVTRVYPFRAEARITEEDPTDPILSGDHILTATWDPGFAVSIALTGTFDLDGDRYDDRDKLAQMIERNGGKIAATHDDEGNRIGKIDPTVRYLVVGDPPSLTEDASAGTKRNSSVITDVMREMQDEAKLNTVEPIDLQKLLNRMGVRAKPKTTQIDPRLGGFPERTPSDDASDNNN